MKNKQIKQQQKNYYPANSLLNHKIIACILPPWSTYLSVKGASRQNDVVS